LQNLVTQQNAQLGANLALAQGFLTQPEYIFGQSSRAGGWLGYGKAVERMVAGEISTDPLLSQLFNPAGVGARGPEILGVGSAQGLIFDITTSNPQTIGAHLDRPYGQNLIIITYDRPPNFTVFP
jgi:hypothetical protein